MVTLPLPPPEVWPLIDLVGETAALALVEARGGTEWYIPRSLPADAGTHPLVQAIGEPLARRVVKDRGGLYLEVPLARQWRIEIYAGRGMRSLDIALTLKCSAHTVSMALRRARAAKKQKAQARKVAAAPAPSAQLDIFRR